MTSVRVRFAPSPTGSTHIGTARTALFNWLYARRNGGTLVLRIEDTDRERNTQAALDELIAGLTWLGIDWDEGPGKEGPYGPYFQSQRGDIYKEYLKVLIDKGRAYESDGAYFFKLEGERYTEHDDYLKADVEKVRSEPVTIHDLIRGDVTRREERDFVIVRSNGDPSFHFVNVVDDIAMKITHVVRGEDHLSNTTKHIELFKAFGVEPPIYAHLPLILKDPALGKGKMSKRDRGALIDEYQHRGYQADAVRNFICLLGWAPKDGQEKLSIAEMIERFDLKDVQKSGARFDEKKMAHLNFEYLKAMPLDEYAAQAKIALQKVDLVKDDVDMAYFTKAVELCQIKIDSFENLPAFADFFFTDNYHVDPKAEEKVAGKADAPQRVQELAAALTELSDWSASALEKTFGDLAATYSLKPFAYFPVSRFAVSGVSSGPELFPMLEVLGKQRVLSRLNAFIAKYSPANPS